MKSPGDVQYFYPPMKCGSSPPISPLSRRADSDEENMENSPNASRSEVATALSEVPRHDILIYLFCGALPSSELCRLMEDRQSTQPVQIVQTSEQEGVSSTAVNRRLLFPA